MLLRENAMSVKEVAAACNITASHLYNLMEGAPNAGNAGVEFQKEYKKILTDCSKRTSATVITLKDKIVEDLSKWNDSLPEAKNLNLKQVKVKKDILDSLARFSVGDTGEPQVHTGLSGEDLVNEFRRMRSLVDLAGRENKEEKKI